MRKLTKRYIIDSLDNLNLSKPIRYERYYINDRLRVQRRDNKYQKEILDNYNNVIEKINISKMEFLELKESSYSEIIRDSYLFLEDSRISIKEYLGKYIGLYRVEVTFNSTKEENEYKKESWMGQEITYSSLAFDKDLSKLSVDEFKKELSNIQHKLGKKVIIFVDELDRCHPIYAIKTLEIIKHFFGIPNVIFVLAIDKKQIENSVRTVFGINIDETDGYLRKFIDVEFVLPVPNLKKLIDFHMDNTMGKIEKFIKDKKYYMYRSTSSIPTEKEKISNLIEKTLCFLMFKPRDVEKYFIRLSLTLDILSKNDILFIEPFVVLNALCLFKGGSEFRNYCGGEETGITKYINTKILKHWENFFNNDEFVKTVRRARQMDSYSQYTKEDNAYEIFYNFFSTGGEAEATKYLNQYPSNIEFINNFNI